MSPSACHPDLLEARLEALAQFFAQTRADTANLHDAGAGDDSWVLGCRSFARWRNLLIQKAGTPGWSWLGIVNPGKRFVFSIGVVPVRFFRGSILRPPERTLAYSAPELGQLALAFDDVETPYAQLHWRFAIETGPLGEPVRVMFAGLAQDDAAVVCQWEIPFALAPSQPVEHMKADDVVEVPAPAVVVPAYKNADHGSA